MEPISLMESINLKHEINQFIASKWVEVYGLDGMKFWLWQNKKIMLKRIGIDLWQREYDEAMSLEVKEKVKNSNQLSLF